VKQPPKRGVAAACALLLALAALAPRAVAEEVTVGISKILAYGAIPIARDKGYFAAEGIDAKLILFDSAQPVAVAVASGDADFGIAGPTAGFYNLAGQGVLRVIAGVNRELPGFHSLAFLVSNRAWDGGLRSFKDLAGHSVAITQIGTPLHYSLGVVAEKYGFDLKSVRVLPLQSNTNVTAALTSGQADAAVFPVTPATPLIARGEVKLLGWVSDEAPGLPGSVLFTGTKTANERGQVVDRFLRAYRKAERDFHDAFVGPDERRKDGPLAPGILPILAKFADLSVEQVLMGIPYIDPEGRLDEQAVRQQIAWYKAQNLLKSQFSGEDLIDKRYVVTVAAVPRPPADP
jgi:NitT/TauT family transport system substrate-binding protein